MQTLSLAGLSDVMICRPENGGIKKDVILTGQKGNKGVLKEMKSKASPSAVA